MAVWVRALIPTAKTRGTRYSLVAMEKGQDLVAYALVMQGVSDSLSRPEATFEPERTSRYRYQNIRISKQRFHGSVLLFEIR